MHFFNLQTSFVAAIGGQDVRETTKGIMKALFSDDLASQLNFCGRGDKRGIGDLKLTRIVIGTLFKLNNYVVQLLTFSSVLLRHGSRKIFLLLNDLSHDPHFSACQNIETLERNQKITNFSINRFSRYLTPNMALQKIIPTSF